MAGHDRPDNQLREGEGRVFFDAVLHPHRSLSPRGFAALMTAAAAVLFAVGFPFFVPGAWPVIGFCGFALLLRYLACRANCRAAA